MSGNQHSLDGYLVNNFLFGNVVIFLGDFAKKFLDYVAWDFYLAENSFLFS
jgi:hypothetical protein